MFLAISASMAVCYKNIIKDLGQNKCVMRETWREWDRASVSLRDKLSVVWHLVLQPFLYPRRSHPARPETLSMRSKIGSHSTKGHLITPCQRSFLATPGKVNKTAPALSHPLASLSLFVVRSGARRIHEVSEWVSDGKIKVRMANTQEKQIIRVALESWFSSLGDRLFDNFAQSSMAFSTVGGKYCKLKTVIRCFPENHNIHD